MTGAGVTVGLGDVVTARPRVTQLLTLPLLTR